ncbi:TolA protein [Acanthamoeba castellanii str. Neff]|uniref:TolA protein n=1 Tax=Acanthamoeba castellanii (strain ATCC 30010 / Neff) TaxID=1257118 RepID=L8HH09_ACACF|nr:TolA protein [Acanthamoeba castellanii str. Neff]ELR23983.1 TolA protein [Acanthamoeba castellanii str. Neff]
MAATDVQKLEALTKLTYKEQAVWLLNGFWSTLPGEAEALWTIVHKCAEIDTVNKAQGCALDEFQAHRFLEHFKETHTVQELREKLRSTGALTGPVIRTVPLIHILIIKYGVDWRELANAPQGNKEEIVKAEAMLHEVTLAFQASEARDAEAMAALKSATAQEAQAKAAEAEARALEADARAREDELRAVKDELEAALNELKAQEDAFKARTAELTRLSEEGSVVQKNKAKNELAQHLTSDPLPLRKAQITQEAVVKKADKARQVAKAAADQATGSRTAAEDSRKAAESARALSEEAKAAAEAAVEETRRRLAEAEAYLQTVKSKLPSGGVWWMERELTDRKSFLPQKQGGYKK